MKLKARITIEIAPIILLLGLLVACTDRGQDHYIDDRSIADETNTSEWLAYGRTHSEQRFSPLDDVDSENVSDLKLDWFLDLPNDVGLVSTPLVVKGVLYFTGTMNVVRAVEATSGKLLWEFDPKVSDHIAGKRQAGWVHNRGITFYDDKVILATWDGRLIAVDAHTGEEIWTAVTFDPSRALYITGAPKAFKGKVIIGNGGTEHGPTRGFVTAYDVETGEQAWKFYIVPGNPADGFENDAMEMAAKTWTGEWWKHGGGGNVWHGFTYDEELDVLYIGTGNGSPWNRKIRSPKGGDNLFLCSILALDPDTGEYKWHYQTNPGETWDYNSNMDIVLADLTIEGKPVKTIMHAPKNGFFYVIDRETGKLISAEPFAKTTWASRIDPTSGRPLEIQGARYENAPADIFPSPIGAHSWHAMSFNPQTGLAYIPKINLGATFTDEGYDLLTWQSEDFVFNVGVDTRLTYAENEPLGELIAWDPVKQEEVWSSAQRDPYNAGTLTTAGNLVFQGQADGHFRAYDAKTGDILWEFNAGLGISAPPITFKIDGIQYVSVLVGYGGGLSGVGWPTPWTYGMHMRRLLTFSLDGEIIPPKINPPHVVKPIKDSTFMVDTGLAEIGRKMFRPQLCANCHGYNAQAGGMAPDLRASPIVLSADLFKTVVRDGAKVGRGMPAFPDITDSDLEALRHYIRKMANDGLAKLEI